MALYEIAFKLSVEKDLRIVSARVCGRPLSRITGLREEPIPRQAIKLAGGHAWYRCHLTISVCGVSEVSTSAPFSPRSTVLEMK